MIISIKMIVKYNQDAWLSNRGITDNNNEIISIHAAWSFSVNLKILFYYLIPDD